MIVLPSKYSPPPLFSESTILMEIRGDPAEEGLDAANLAMDRRFKAARGGSSVASMVNAVPAFNGIARKIPGR